MATKIGRPFIQGHPDPVIMATNVELAQIEKFDCRSDPTSLGERWKRWKRGFEMFVDAKGIENDKQKRAMLLHCAGMDVLDIFDTLPVPKDEKGADKDSQHICSDNGNVIGLFRTRSQHSVRALSVSPY